MNSARPTVQSILIVAAAALGTRDIFVEPVLIGGSTYVYRVTCGQEVLYLRVLPEVEGSFAPEAAAHSMLR